MGSSPGMPAAPGSAQDFTGGQWNQMRGLFQPSGQAGSPGSDWNQVRSMLPQNVGGIPLNSGMVSPPAAGIGGQPNPGGPAQSPGLGLAGGAMQPGGSAAQFPGNPAQFSNPAALMQRWSSSPGGYGSAAQGPWGRAQFPGGPAMMSAQNPYAMALGR